MILRRRNALVLFVVEVVLFVLAGVTSKSNKHPGTVSNVFWDVFLSRRRAFDRARYRHRRSVATVQRTLSREQ